MDGQSVSPPSDAQLRPRIHHASTFRTDPILEQTIRAFTNKGYRYIAPKDASRWEEDAFDGDRLPTADSIHHQLGERGFFAVIYDPQDASKPVACAGSTPWKGDLDGHVAPGERERGWEIKIVTTQSGWMKAGLGGRCIDAAVDELKRLEQTNGKEGDRKLKVWVQAVECLNGPFWRKKDWEQVRAYEKPVGHWGSKAGYQLLVLLKEFDL